MNGKNLLLIEDNPNDVELFKFEFRKKPYHIDVAETVGEAFRKLKAHRYRGVFIDLTLGPSRAEPVIRWVKENRPAMLIAVLTGAPMNEKELRSLTDSGSLHVFTKPFTADDIAWVENQLDYGHANFEAGKPKRSMKTTVCGAAAMIVSALPFFPFFNKNPLYPLMAGVFLAGLCGVFGVDATVFYDWAKNIRTKKES